MKQIQEIDYNGKSGIATITISLLIIFFSIGLFILAANARSGDGGFFVLIGFFGIALSITIFIGLFQVNPNEGVVLQLFGEYIGTCKAPGLHWANPFLNKTAVSLRIRNFESGRLKVNDHAGNPVEIATVVVWQVVDTAEAIFHVEYYEKFVIIQSESALRNLATQYPYDNHEVDGIALRSHTLEVAAQLKLEIQERLAKAGIEVIEARISHLAYAPEIAGVMLQRQQANAIISARQKIVEGAVGMIEMALDMLDKKKVVKLDDDRKAAIVSNLLVVLCGERATQPIINASTTT
jgi:regulator of protease activity HflC (stomatin/prohibitin superfamily)